MNLPPQPPGLLTRLGSTAQQGVKALGGNIMQGLGLGLAAAAVSGAGIAANKAHEALTQRRDFRRMMASPFNQDLKEYHDRDPNAFNTAFSELRAANHEMSATPMVAGTYMRRMFTFSPEAAGGVLIEAMNNRNPDLSPMRDAFQRAGIEGAKLQLQDRMQNEGERARFQHQHQLETNKHRNQLQLEGVKSKLRIAGDREKKRLDLGFVPLLDQNRMSRLIGPEELARQEQTGRNTANLAYEGQLHQKGLGKYAP